MNLTIRPLGCEVLAIDTTRIEAAEQHDDPGDVTANGFGFISTTPMLDDGREGWDI